MPRSVNSVASRARRKKSSNKPKVILVEGKCLDRAKNAVEKAMLYAYRDRRTKNVTSIFVITRINAGAREHGLSYSQFMGKVKSNNIELNRKF